MNKCKPFSKIMGCFVALAVFCAILAGCTSNQAVKITEADEPFGKLTLYQSYDEIVSILGEPDSDTLWGAVTYYHDAHGFGSTGTLSLVFDGTCKSDYKLIAACYTVDYPGSESLDDIENYEPARREEIAAKKLLRSIEAYYTKKYGKPTDTSVDKQDKDAGILSWNLSDGSTIVLEYLLNTYRPIWIYWAEME